MRSLRPALLLLFPLVNGFMGCGVRPPRPSRLPSSDTDILEGTETLVLTLEQHRPSMGCSVEESLAGGGHVFVSDVKQAGHAEEAGMQVGDVIVAVSGIFGGLEDVSGLGLEKVKALVSGRPEDESLQLRIVRGSSIIDDHESVLADLCANPDTSDAETEQCVLDFIQGGYFDDADADETNDANDGDNPNPEDDEQDNAVASLMNMWAEEFPQTPASPEPEAEQKVEKPKPWSSRASPSGTFVRDPVTGEMRNIDA